LVAPLQHFYASTLLRGVPPQIPLPTGNGAIETANEPFEGASQAFEPALAPQNGLGLIKNAVLAG